MLKLKQKILAGILAGFAMFIFTSNSLAAGTTLIPQDSDNKELATSFRTGEFELWQLGNYAQYLIEALILFAGGIAVLFVVIGGYKYMIGSISDDKEAGKKTIAYALAGFGIAVLAWTVVNFVQVWLTSGS